MSSDILELFSISLYFESLAVAEPPLILLKPNFRFLITSLMAKSYFISRMNRIMSQIFYLH